VKRPHRAAGFTLIELMVALAIMAILAGVAAPAMRELIAAQRVRTMASDFHLALMKTRSEALKRNVSVTLVATGGNWATGWSILDPEAPTGPAIDVRAGNADVAVTATQTQVVYRGSGRIAAAPTAFVFASTSSAETRCVSIDAAGRPYAVKGATC